MNVRQIMFVIAAAFVGAACAFLAGCATEPGPVHMTETECRINSDCEIGSYCDPFLQLCGWDCRDDSECELGMYCDPANGRCLREEMPPSPVECASDDECAPGMFCDLAAGQCLRVEEMTEDGATALIVEFAPVAGNLIPNVDWNFAGTVDISAFGGDVAVSTVDVSGANLGLLNGFSLEQGGTTVAISAATETITQIVFSDPLILRAGERASFDVMIRLRTPVEYFGSRITLRPENVSASPLSGDEPVRIATSRIRDTEFRLWQSVPSVTRQTLSSTTLANGIDQDLYKVQVNRSYTAPVRVGSLSYRLSGLTGTLSNFRARVGSTDLPYDSYRVENTYGEPIDLRAGTLDVRGAATGYSANITVVFIGGLEVDDPMSVTLHATPAEFAPGSSLTIRFGDRGFEGLSGEITDDGHLRTFDGTLERIDTDAIVWTDDTRGVWTGSWGIRDLDEVETLTR